MNVLIITSEIRSRSGYGRVSLELIKSFKKNNFEVLVVCNKKGEEIGGVKQIEILPKPLNPKRNFLLAWFYVLKLLRYRNVLNKCDLMHCFIEEYSFFTFLLSMILRKKYFLLMHGTYAVAFFRNKIYGLLQNIAYENAEKIVCISNYTKDNILKHIRLNNLIIIPNGVNLDNFNINQNEYYSNNKENILISVGAFKKRKGFEVLIKALNIVVKEIPDIKCYIGGGAAGSNDYYNKMVELAEYLDIRDNIIFFKNESDDYIKDLYKKAKVFALTLVNEEYNFDGFGVVYLEANAYGIPVVGVYGTGAEDAINDGYSGFLAKYNNINDIAQKIITILKDVNLYNKVSGNTVLWAREMSWDNIIKNYIKLYDNTVFKSR